MFIKSQHTVRISYLPDRRKLGGSPGLSSMNLSNLGVAKKTKDWNKENALSFISGGKPLKARQIKDRATNNIVGFQRPGTQTVVKHLHLLQI